MNATVKCPDGKTYGPQNFALLVTCIPCNAIAAAPIADELQSELLEEPSLAPVEGETPSGEPPPEETPPQEEAAAGPTGRRIAAGRRVAAG